jgi:uncharacterized metal-binding protein
MKGNTMSATLITELENATDDEIVGASNKLARIMTNKIVIGVVASVIAHFASDFIITAIEGKKKATEITE